MDYRVSSLGKWVVIVHIFSVSGKCCRPAILYQILKKILKMGIR